MCVSSNKTTPSIDSILWMSLPQHKQIKMLFNLYQAIASVFVVVPYIPAIIDHLPRAQSIMQGDARFFCYSVRLARSRRSPRSLEIKGILYTIAYPNPNTFWAHPTPHGMQWICCQDIFSWAHGNHDRNITYFIIVNRSLFWWSKPIGCHW